MKPAMKFIKQIIPRKSHVLFFVGAVFITAGVDVARMYPYRYEWVFVMSAAGAILRGSGREQIKEHHAKAQEEETRR